MHGEDDSYYEERLRKSAQAYAARRDQFLQENFPKFLSGLKQAGEHESYLETLGWQAAESAEAITDQLHSSIAIKQLPYLEKVAKFEAIPHIVDEIISADLIYNPPGS